MAATIRLRALSNGRVEQTGAPAGNADDDHIDRRGVFWRLFRGGDNPQQQQQRRLRWGILFGGAALTLCCGALLFAFFAASAVAPPLPLGGGNNNGEEATTAPEIARAAAEFFAKVAGPNRVRPKKQQPADFVDAVAAGPRGLLHISTDKGVYREGDTVHVRVVALDAFNHSALPGLFDSVLVEVLTPRGGVAHSVRASVRGSVADAEWAVPKGTAGGEFSVKARPATPHLRFVPPAKRSFSVRAYRPPRISVLVEFGRGLGGYSPGEKATATVLARRAEGGACAGCSVGSAKATFTLRGGKQAAVVELAKQQPLSLGPTGGIALAFDVPADAESGTLSLTIEDGGVVESVTKTIPVVAGESSVTVKLFPESGDVLVAGVRTRVYFEATNSWGDPVDVSGLVLAHSKTVTSFKSLHEGRGFFEFVPVSGTRHRVEFSQPSTGVPPIDLPLPQDTAAAAAIHAKKPVFDAGEHIEVEIGVPPLSAPTSVLVSLFHRELLLDTKTVAFAASPTSQTALVALSAGPSAAGVLRVTAFKGEAGLALAERLVFRKPATALRISLKPDASEYMPGSVVKLAVHAQDAITGKPLKANVGLAVTDASVLDMIEPRQRPPRLPAMAFLEQEVLRLGDSRALFSESGVGSAEAIDLLLGVQAWRRFGFFDPEAFIKREGDKALGVLAFNNEPYPDIEVAHAFGGRNRHPMLENFALADFAAMPKAMKAAPPRAPGVHEEVDDAAETQDEGDGEQQQQGEAAPIKERVNFADTVFWNAAVQTDEAGNAEVSFRLGDQITSFAALADGFTSDGILGFSEARIEARKPFYIQPKTPVHLTVGDHAIIPIPVINDSPGSLDIQLSAGAISGITLPRPAKNLQRIQLEKGRRTRQLLEADATSAGGNGTAFLSISASAGNLGDAVRVPINVYPRGFPVDIDNGGTLSAGNTTKITIDVPPGAKNLEASLLLYPSPAANLQQALEALIREPFGCFEQASSTTYPAVMAAQYFASHGVSPASPAVKKAQNAIEKGYKLLTSYEVDKGGFEWFGAKPAHESLTAYGLLEFVDMARVFPVDEALLKRTKDWLLGRRSEDGTSFLRNPKALDSFGAAPGSITNAYIVWSLTFAGIREGLDGVIAELDKQSETSEDTYFLGLVAGINANIGKDARARELGRKVQKHQREDGSVPNSETSITRSGGEPLLIETSSISVLAWIKYEEFSGAVERAVAWLATRCKDGKFGSTQGTVLALKAIIAYDLKKQKASVPFSAVLRIDGRPVEEALYDPASKSGDVFGPLSFNSGVVSQAISGEGVHKIELSLHCTGAGGGNCKLNVPFSFHARYFADVPASSLDPELSFSVSTPGLASGAGVQEGSSVQIRASVGNLRSTAQGMVVAIVGLPGGLEVRHDKLKELVGAGSVDFFEVLPQGDVVFYWRSLGPRSQVDVLFDAQAAVPGTFVASASRAYPYYNDAEKTWVAPLETRVSPLEQEIQLNIPDTSELSSTSQHELRG